MLTLKIITAGAAFATITLALLLTPIGLELVHTLLVGLFA
jgi:hypothetical protein